MEWIKTKKENHHFFMIRVNEQVQDFEWAIQTARAKTKFTFNTWQRGRTSCKIFTNHFLGDLAKNLFKSFLLKERPQYKERILEYDRLRTDNFRIKDDYDLAIETNDKIRLNIEVKSSGEKKLQNADDFFENRRIVININNQHQHFEWAVVQIMFIPQNMSFFENENIPCNNFDSFIDGYIKAFKENNVVAYIVGYADEKMQREYASSIYSVKNFQARALKRDYADLRIKNSKPISLFIEELDRILESNTII